MAGTAVGSVKLDPRGAEMAGPEIGLRVKTVVGSVKVWVPGGVRVEVGGYPNAPVLRLDTVVGSVKVYRV